MKGLCIGEHLGWRHSCGELTGIDPEPQQCQPVYDTRVYGIAVEAQDVNGLLRTGKNDKVTDGKVFRAETCKKC